MGVSSSSSSSLPNDCLQKILVSYRKGHTSPGRRCLRLSKAELVRSVKLDNCVSPAAMKQTKTLLSEPEFLTRAIEKYRQLIANNPEKAEIHANLGSLYAKQKQWSKAIACYQKALEIDPHLAGVYRNLAKILSQIGREKQAVEYLYRALQLEPKWAEAKKHYSLGNLLWTQNKLNKAANCFRQAIDLQPNFFPAYYRLGELLTAKGLDRQALTVYRQGIKANPQNPQFHFCLGQALAARQKWKQASNRYRYLLELAPDFAIGYYSWGVVLGQQHQWLEAKYCYQKAIDLQPNYWEAHHQLGLVLHQQKLLKDAIAVHQKVRQLNPNFVPTYLELGSIYLELGESQAAIDCYRQAIEITPEDSPLAATSLEKYQQAVASHQQPTAEIYYYLGRLLRARGDFDGAVAAYQQAIELNPKFQAAYIDLQYTQILPDRLPQLIEFYRTIVDRQSEIPIAWGNLGDALTQHGKINEAIECYRTSCYQRTISLYPDLAKLDWQKTKQQAPDFIIIGAEKCGTSSLYHYLSHHPQILLPHKKELDFFWRNYERGIDWYLAHFPSISDRTDFLTGEATPNYLRFIIAARRIKQHFPKIKLIVLLRNPVERAISWHYHKVNTGLTSGSFQEIFKSEIELIANLSEAQILNTGYYNPDNLLSSIYLYKLRAWIELFGRDSFLILKSEDLYEQPAKVMTEVLHFLKLSDRTLENYPKVNAGSYTGVDDSTKQILAEYFQPYNQQLESYLGIKFNWN
jgi:tetratricopeptide (TPR) repeat protein